MFIFAVHIENFRLIRDGWMFPNPGINVLLGPNNSGKTTFLRAYQLALDPLLNWNREDLVSRFDYWNGRVTEPILIRVWLKPHEDESDEIVTRFFDKLSKWTVKTSNGHPMSLEPVRLDPTSNQVPEHEELLAVVLTSEWDISAQIAHVDEQIQDEVGNRVAAFSNEYKRAIDFKFFSTRRDPLQQLSLSRRSLLSRSLDEAELNTALRDLLSALENAKDKLVQQTQVRQVLARLSGLIAPELLQGLATTVQDAFTLTFLNADTGRLRAATSLAIRIAPPNLEGDTTGTQVLLPLEFQGEGVQNLLLLMNIVDLINSSGSSSIIVVEEPEQNLEPSLARWAASQLCSPLSPSPNQVFMTTHSPALVGELSGAETLLLLPARRPKAQQTLVVRAGRCLAPATQKTFERERDKYGAALLARHVLVVEGDSEMGLLPVAFRHLAQGKAQDNPFHLGLEMLKAGSRELVLQHARCLTDFERPTYMLIDHDPPEKGKKTTSDLLGEAKSAGLTASCWGDHDGLPFAAGCDLEVVLVREVVPSILLPAIILAYEDAGHELSRDEWQKACNKVREPARSLLPAELPETLRSLDLSGLGDDLIQRAFLFALLHGPHSCKAVKDMRMIAEHLAAKNALPAVLDVLRQRLVAAILEPESAHHDSPYLIKLQPTC